MLESCSPAPTHPTSRAKIAISDMHTVQSESVIRQALDWCNSVQAAFWRREVGRWVQLPPMSKQRFALSLCLDHNLNSTVYFAVAYAAAFFFPSLHGHNPTNPSPFLFQTSPLILCWLCSLLNWRQTAVTAMNLVVEKSAEISQIFLLQKGGGEFGEHMRAYFCWFFFSLSSQDLTF